MTATLRLRTWPPEAKWTAQPPRNTWRTLAPTAKWTAWPVQAGDTTQGEIVPLTLSTLSTTYVRVPVYADQLGIQVNPTTYTVTMAFISGPANPGASDWRTASWTTTAQGQYVAQCLVGPNGGTITLTAGLTYTVWLQIAATPETVVIDTGQIQIQ